MRSFFNRAIHFENPPADCYFDCDYGGRARDGDENDDDDSICRSSIV